MNEGPPPRGAALFALSIKRLSACEAVSANSASSLWMEGHAIETC